LSLRSSLRIQFVRISVFITDRSSLKFKDICLRKDSRNAGGDDYPIHGFGLINTVDDVRAHVLYVIQILIGADMGYMTHPLTSFKNIVETSVIVQIS
jgi:hypothetical protein